MDGSRAGIGLVCLFYVYMIILIFNLKQCDLVPALLASVAFSTFSGLIGFLFGVPKTLQTEAWKSGPSPNDFGNHLSVNTNLEQISDWLTKLLVGIGLVELREIPMLLQRLTAFLAPAMCHDRQAADVLSLLIVLTSSVVGFSFAYMATRLYLAQAFKQADQHLQEDRG